MYSQPDSVPKVDRMGSNSASWSTLLPNKQKPVKNTKLSGLFHSRDLWISRDNSRVVKVFVDDLMTGLGPSFSTAKTWVYFTAKTWVYFTWCTRDLYMRKLFFSHLFVSTFLKNLGKGGGGILIDFWYINIYYGKYCV